MQLTKFANGKFPCIFGTNTWFKKKILIWKFSKENLEFVMCKYYCILLKMLLTSYYFFFLKKTQNNPKTTCSPKKEKHKQKRTTTQNNNNKKPHKTFSTKNSNWILGLDRVIFIYSSSLLLFSNELFSHDMIRSVREKLQRLHNLMAYRTLIITLRFSMFMWPWAICLALLFYSE